MTPSLPSVRSPLNRSHGRAYFAIQALAGLAWWVGVFTVAGVRPATLGSLDPIAVAVVDVPLFVLASAAAAFGLRWAVWVAVPWTILAALGMAVYATVTTEAGLGAVLMIAAAAASAIAGLLVVLGRVPSERLFRGPLAFRSSRISDPHRLLVRTGVQLVCVWGILLIIVPWIVSAAEERWGLAVKFPILVVVAGFAALVLASALGIWSAVTLARFGGGTPLPSEMPTRLVDDGPYRFIRHPMILAAVVQGAAIGLFIGSWAVIVCAVAGALLWTWMLRPHEEAELSERFGEDYTAYRASVSGWFPRPRSRRRG